MLLVGVEGHWLELPFSQKRLETLLLISKNGYYLVGKEKDDGFCPFVCCVKIRWPSNEQPLLQQLAVGLATG